ncbi:methyl-accepting chemotaxis protein [Microcoleus sp. FACHB-831]|uniref:methyl-accepting chemotaxis protein n=1 Tax=Microcoleus sp. FACHB-831 TaxID=2692827 RepID=UPI0016851049|nr:methyl-accepting chemotaxis protein [Microcoleus sp. FACHB-831]MBD1923282.1 methyl-accepting chemotaxis protein [Microcoleus sp. FACHB-831]
MFNKQDITKQPPQPKNTGSITKKTLYQIALSVAIVVAVAAAINYFQFLSLLKFNEVEQLKNYVVERVEREKIIFALAADNQESLKQEIIRKYLQTNQEDPQVQFDNLFAREKDGVIRNRPELFDGTRQAGVYIDKSLPINADIRRHVIDFKELVESYGPAWHNRFQNIYIMTPENIMVEYWPEIPTWVQDATANLYLPKEEYYFVADAKHNPARKTVWTGLIYDEISKLWMVSAETPVDINGKQIATVGQDVMLNELMQRTITDHIEGGYNLIFRADGRLIAHPNLMDKIQEEKGLFNILNSDDDHLKNIFQLAKHAASGEIIIDDVKDGEYLAVTKIEGPDWYFVTGFPKSILTKQALNVAAFNLIMGVGVLLILVIVVFLVLQNQVAQPLKQLISATNQIAEGDYNISLEDNRQDELGRLAQSFNIMAAEIASRSRELQSALEQQAISVQEATTTMDELLASSRISAEQAEAAAAGAKQVLFLIEGNEENAAINGKSSLREKVAQLAQEILRLSDQTRQIGTISTLVSDLANQTNMLALNAAVEAARAGEHGKGFNVIATEIRKVADQSKGSAQKINALVRDIQTATNSTVMVTEEGKKNVEGVVDAVHNITLNSQQISLNANQQAIAISQVVQAMNHLNKVASQYLKNSRN